MGIMNTDRTLASNQMIFMIRRNPDLYNQFPEALEKFMSDYDLSNEEKKAWREEDISKLAELGVHPYFLPQISRLFRGAAYNHNTSDAAQLYALHMVKGDASDD